VNTGSGNFAAARILCDGENRLFPESNVICKTKGSFQNGLRKRIFEAALRLAGQV